MRYDFNKRGNMSRAEKKLAEIRAKEELAKIKLEQRQKKQQDLEEARQKWAEMPSEQKRTLKIIGIILVILILVGIIGSLGASENTPKDSSTQQTDRTTSEQKEVAKEKTPKEKIQDDILSLISSKQAYDSGSYIKGDIPKGEYAFIPIDGNGKYYSEEDEAGNIVDNENFDSFGYVYIHGVGNISTQGVLIPIASFAGLGATGAKDIYEKLNDTSGYSSAAMYKVGVDLEPGQYTLESIGSGYAAVLTGPVGNNDIVDNENFNGRHSVSVQNGQYLSITRAKIAQ